MQAIKETIYTGNYPTFHLVPTKKFKTITFHAKFLSPLDRKSVTKRALYSNLLQQGIRSFPSNRKLKQELAKLYGANIATDCVKKGNYHIVQLKLDVVNEKYVTDELSLLNRAIKLFDELLFEPYRINDQFPKDILEREKNR